MNLFSKKHSLLAVCNGRAADISEIPDEALSSGMLGLGYGIDPSDGLFCSPVDGRVESIAESLHAYTIVTSSGLDLLLHIGVDTVTLGGKGFTPLVKKGAAVQAGTPLVQVDLDLIREAGLPTFSAVLITDTDRLGKTDYQFGQVAVGKDAVMTFRLKQ